MKGLKLSLIEIIDILSYLTLFLFICCLESIFFSSTSFIVDIDIWILPIVFFSLHRTQFQAFIFLALSSFILYGFTGTPVFEIILSVFLTHFFVSYVKHQSYTKGSAYFYLISFFSILVFYFSIFVINYLFYSDLVTINALVLGLILSLTTPAFVFLFKPVFILLDSVIGVKYPFGFEA